MRGQVSNELLVVVGFIILILIPLLYIMFFKMEAINMDLAMLQVHFSVARLAFLINAIGYMGDGSSMITEIHIPNNVAEVSIGSPDGNSNEVVFTLIMSGELRNEIVQPTAFPIEIGSEAPTFREGDSTSGRYRVEIYNQGGTIFLSNQPSPSST